MSDIETWRSPICTPASCDACKMEASPKPGSDEAATRGCTCPRSDNAFGEGRGGDGALFGWYVTESCPMHGKEAKSHKEQR